MICIRLLEAYSDAQKSLYLNQLIIHISDTYQVIDKKLSLCFIWIFMEFWLSIDFLYFES